MQLATVLLPISSSSSKLVFRNIITPLVHFTFCNLELFFFNLIKTIYIMAKVQFSSGVHAHAS